jgi:hypothetical protein
MAGGPFSGLEAKSGLGAKSWRFPILLLVKLVPNCNLVLQEYWFT